MKTQKKKIISDLVSESFLISVCRQIRIWQIILTVLLFMTSCAAPVSVYIDVLQPSRMSRRYPVDSMLVINNCQKWKPFEIDDTLYVPVQMDTLFRTVTQKLVDSECTDYLVRVDSGLNTIDSCFVNKIPDSVIVRSSDDYNIRTILSIDNAYAKIPLVTTDENCWADACICMTFSRVGDRLKKENSVIVGRLYYKGNKIKEEDLQDDLVRRLSDDVVRGLMPYWKTSGRRIYTSLSSDLRYGYLAYINGKSEMAEQLWRTAAKESSFRKLRVAAYINLAFLMESEDRLGDALQCLDNAERSMGKKKYDQMQQLISKYREVLNYRINMSKYLK